jgi:hypothetical protein
MMRHFIVPALRDRKFADSSLEGAVRCELVSAAGPTPPIKGSFIRRSDEFLESIKKGLETQRSPTIFLVIKIYFT